MMMGGRVTSAFAHLKDLYNHHVARVEVYLSFPKLNTGYIFLGIYPWELQTLVSTPNGFKPHGGFCRLLSDGNPLGTILRCG